MVKSSHLMSFDKRTKTTIAMEARCGVVVLRAASLTGRLSSPCAVLSGFVRGGMLVLEPLKVVFRGGMCERSSKWLCNYRSSALRSYD